MASGLLASSMLPENSSCKLYSNSSGNAASVTIHAVVPDNATNACLSFKLSGTDACVVCTSTSASCSLAVNDVLNIVTVPSTLGYAGFQKFDRSTDKPINYSQYTDSAGNVASNPCAVDKVYRRGVLPKNKSNDQCIFSNEKCRITSSTYWGVCSFCCPCHEINTAAGGCLTLAHHMNRYQQNFHTSDSGESHHSIFMYCCEMSSNTAHSYVRVRKKCQGATDCCDFCFATVEKTYETSKKNFRSNCCPSGNDACEFTPQNMGSFHSGQGAHDIWSEFDTFVWAPQIVDPASCGCGCVSILDRSENNCRATYNNAGLNCCCMEAVSMRCCLRSIMRECCQRCGCCLCTENHCVSSMYPARKMWMAGCDVFMTQDITDNNQKSVIIMTPFACYSTMRCNNCCYQCSVLQGPWRKFGRGSYTTGQCQACCTAQVTITDVGGGQIKWVWYNPYVNCNYFLVLGKSSTDDGVYSIEPNCFAPFCDSANTDSSNNETLSTYVTACQIIKVCMPTSWTRFTCFDSGAGRNTFFTNPTLTGKCCWSVYAQCFNFGDKSLDGTGWNGCMLKYISSNLYNWTLASSTNVSSSGSIGTHPDTECQIINTYNGSAFTLNVDHFFNSDNCVNNAGLVEYKTSANRLERTGVVIGNNQHLYVNNLSGAACTSVQVWGYDE